MLSSHAPMAALSIALSFLLAVPLSSAKLLTTGTTVLLGEDYYFVHPDVLATVNTSHLHGSNEGGLRPMTVFNGFSGAADLESEVTAAIHKHTADDDVWTPEFLEVVVTQYSDYAIAKRSPPFVKTTTILNKRSTIMSSSTKLANGPYFVDFASGNTYMGYRLFSDFTEAFTETLISNSKGQFSVLPANVPGQNLAVAVPSRMHYTKTKTQPLAGVRLGVKDIYDIKGIRTSDGNRAWYHFYPPANATAPAVQRLIDAGAVVLGKMKTSQFANGETATADWVDYHEPFNPRGDGYQDTSSSSSGPGAGEAAYPWLDISIGSDTGGSIRGPSEVQGLYGNRPSHGMVTLDHVMPLAPQLDTAGFIARDPKLWAEAANVLYGGLRMNWEHFPKKILLFEFPAEANNKAQSLLLRFANELKNFVSGHVETYDLRADFKKTGPKNSPTRDLNLLLNITYPILISQNQVQLVRDPFFKAYAAKYDGRTPFVDPVPLVRWAFGDSFPPLISEAIKNKTIFEDWFNSHVLAPSNESCSDALLLYVGSNGSQDPRNQYLSPPVPPYGFSAGRISPFSSGPDYVLPLGQASHESTITNHLEFLPVTVDIVASKGCDGMLFSLVNALVKSNILDPSVTGRSLVNGKDILFRRGMEWADQEVEF